MDYQQRMKYETLKKLNEKEQCKLQPYLRVHYIFHAGCLNCVTPLHYGIGNCVGCYWYNGVTSKFPSLKIENYEKF